MNITLTSLEALTLKATHESLPCPDAAALEAFCAVMRDSAEGPQYAAQALAARIHSLNSREALLALTMLDRCMRRCDASFHAEIGKFRFLNEMIKLVSPKYYADRTAPEVRTRVVQLLHAWSIEYPKETKFKAAYDMLKNQGVVKETPPPLPPEDLPQVRIRAKSAVFEDEEKSKLLQKLLQSKKPEDLQHANRLIKTMVREEERRNEANSRRAKEVTAALDSAGLLRDMLAASPVSPDDRQLMLELRDCCARLHKTLQKLASQDIHADRIGEIVDALEVLDNVLENYDAFINDTKETQVTAPDNSHDSLLDFAGAAARPDAPRPDAPRPKPQCVKDNNAIYELGDIFSTETASTSITEPLKPVNLMPIDDVDLLGEKKKTEGWNELDSLSEQLLKQSLPDNVRHHDGFNSKTTRKIPMNALEKHSPNHDTQSSNNGHLLDLDYFIKPEEIIPAPLTQPLPSGSPSDDAMVDITPDLPNPHSESNGNNDLNNILDINLRLDMKTKCDKTSVSNVNTNNECKKRNVNVIQEVKSLHDINVTLDSVQPSRIPSMQVIEGGGLSVTVHFCKDKPRPDVYVLVISTTSKNPEPVENFKLEGLVPKCCEIRFVSTAEPRLAAYRPFLPPPTLTHLALMRRPDGANASLALDINCSAGRFRGLLPLPLDLL